MAQPTLLDIAKRNAADPTVGLIDESFRCYPEISGQTMFLGKPIQLPNVGAARTIKGLNYKTLVRTALPTVAFRNANEGAASSVGVMENRLVETYIFNPRWECDVAIADRSEDGPAAFIAEEANAMMLAGFKTMALQFYYGAGTNGDAKGHPGLINAYDSTNMVVDAGGTTDSVASSVWAVKWGPQGVRWVWGNEGQLQLADLTKVRILDANSNPYTAYSQEILAYPGLQVGTVNCVGRIKKLTTDSGKGLTDALISSLLSKFPAGWGPDVLFMSRRSLQQLQASRTATNEFGNPAPFPTESFGIPIAPTDAILNTELLAS